MTTDIIIRKGVSLFASSSIDDISFAREYIKRNSLTSDDVKIVSNNENIAIITKRDVTLKRLTKNDV